MPTLEIVEVPVPLARPAAAVDVAGPPAVVDSSSSSGKEQNNKQKSKWLQMTLRSFSASTSSKKKKKDSNDDDDEEEDPCALKHLEGVIASPSNKREEVEDENKCAAGDEDKGSFSPFEAVEVDKEEVADSEKYADNEPFRASNNLEEEHSKPRFRQPFSSTEVLL